MTLHEFDIIKTFFEKQKLKRHDVTLGIGDDAALVNIPTNHQLAITTDTLVASIHFSEATSAVDIGYKSLSVNLSDLAAMGATPAWVTLALTLPHADETWLKEFSDGFFSLADHYDTQLIGGDITHGPLSITVQAYGLIPKDSALTRNNAKIGDLIYVTHTLGDAGLALRCLQQKISLEKKSYDTIIEKLNRPEPQIIIGEKLRGIANAAIDVSDGLAADLSHILERSSVGARIFVDAIPLSSILSKSLSQNDAIKLALTAGDDYELCFTVPENKKSLLEKTLPYRSHTCIGVITATSGLDLQFKQGEKYVIENQGYQHF